LKPARSSVIIPGSAKLFVEENYSWKKNVDLLESLLKGAMIG